MKLYFEVPVSEKEFAEELAEHYGVEGYDSTVGMDSEHWFTIAVAFGSVIAQPVVQDLYDKVKELMHRNGRASIAPNDSGDSAVIPEDMTRDQFGDALEAMAGQDDAEC